MGRSIALALLLAVTNVVAAPCRVVAAPYRVETVAEGLEHPWSIAFVPDGRMLVTERPGRLRVIENGKLRDAPLGGVPPVFANAQAGLFDVVVDREFATNRTIYVSFAHGTDEANHTRVVRATLGADSKGNLALENVTPIFTAQPAKQGGAHFGARIAQLGDGTLAIGIGDGFDWREKAQALDSHLGKIVRVRTDGSVPDDNPFVREDGVLPEIYTFGHRNPQALVFDAVSGALYAHEHGPRGGDELNRLVAGRNYGWPMITYGVDYTGALVTPYTELPGLEQPLVHWTPSIAPAGMTLYRGAMFPEWQGSLFVSALVERSVRRVVLDAPGGVGEQEVLFTEIGARLRDVREGPDGALYLLTDDARGKVLRVVPYERLDSGERR